MLKKVSKFSYPAGISIFSGDGKIYTTRPSSLSCLGIVDLIAQGLVSTIYQLSIKLPTRGQMRSWLRKEIEVWEGLWQAIIAQPVLSNGRRPAYHQKPMNTQSVFQSDVSLVILLLGRRSFSPSGGCGLRLEQCKPPSLRKSRSALGML